MLRVTTVLKLYTNITYSWYTPKKLHGQNVSITFPNCFINRLTLLCPFC